MCGIFGVCVKRDACYSKKFIDKSLRILAAESQSRGKDSSGIVFYNEKIKTYHVIKGAVPLNYLMSSTDVTTNLNNSLNLYCKGKRSTFSVIGHSRLVTNGSQLSNDNNQPVIKDDIIAIHNGIIVNDATLWENNSELAREYEIDTEIFLALIRKHLKEGDDIPGAIARTEFEINGTISTAFYIPDYGVLALFTNHGSLYVLTNKKDVLFFASEYYPLHILAKKMKIKLEGEFEIRQIEGGNGVIIELDMFILKRFSSRDYHGNKPDTSRRENKYEYSIITSNIGNNKKQIELVSDVALIAKAPEATKFAAMLEFNFERIAKLRRCSKCLLPETFPFIKYDHNGICNYCKNFKIKNQPKPLDDLLTLLKPYRHSDGTPDCIVPFSGGRDSTYALHVIKTKLGLNPIAFTYDWGMVTDLGRRNIARVCGKLGVEHIIVAADIHWKRNNIRKNISAWLKKPHLGMIPLFMAGDKYFYYYVERVKKQTNISLNIWGINPMENTDFKVGFIGVGPDHDKEHIYSLSIKRQLKLFQGVAQAVLSNPAYCNSSVFDTIGSFISRSVMPHRDYFHLYDYLRWDEQEIDRLLLNEYDWETAIDTKTTWRIGDGTAAFYNYIYFNVAGFSEHDTFRSNQIREGMISREQGLRLINEENQPRYATIKWYTDAVNIDYENTIHIINNIPKLYN